MTEPQEEGRIRLRPKEENIAKVKTWRESLAAAAVKKEEYVVRKRNAVVAAAAATDALLEFVGAQMPDGTVFAGVMPDGKKLYAMPQDAGKAMDFNAAAAYAVRVNRKRKLGHHDWRVPTREELDILHQNREKGALRDTFNQDAKIEHLSDGEYWSSTPAPSLASESCAYAKCFGDGYNARNDIKVKAAVRLVR